MLAANHPNSFLDAIILDALFHQPIWSLARGDVFKKKWARKILRALKILPVYRVSEGVENLSSNYDTFNSCIEIFKQKGIVLIFSEGKCINEWHLRPLKKGTARLAMSCWKQQIPLRVLPVAINYSSFREYGKNLSLYFGTPIESGILNNGHSEGQSLVAFNNELQSQLSQYVYEIAPEDDNKKQSLLHLPISPLKKILFALPAGLGLLLHAPLYLPVKSWLQKKLKDSDHYDSIQFGMLLLLYPVYVMLIAVVLLLITGSAFSWLIVMLMPLFAYCALHLKKQ